VCVATILKYPQLLPHFKADFGKWFLIFFTQPALALFENLEKSDDMAVRSRNFDNLAPAYLLARAVSLTDFPFSSTRKYPKEVLESAPSAQRLYVSLNRLILPEKVCYPLLQA